MSALDRPVLELITTKIIVEQDGNCDYVQDEAGKQLCNVCWQPYSALSACAPFHDPVVYWSICKKCFDDQQVKNIVLCWPRVKVIRSAYIRRLRRGER